MGKKEVSLKDLSEDRKKVLIEVARIFNERETLYKNREFRITAAQLKFFAECYFGEYLEHHQSHVIKKFCLDILASPLIPVASGMQNVITNDIKNSMSENERISFNTAFENAITRFINVYGDDVIEKVMSNPSSILLKKDIAEKIKIRQKKKRLIDLERLANNNLRATDRKRSIIEERTAQRNFYSNVSVGSSSSQKSTNSGSSSTLQAPKVVKKGEKSNGLESDEESMLQLLLKKKKEKSRKRKNGTDSEKSRKKRK